MNKNIYLKIWVLTIFVSIAISSKAQVGFFKTGYFQNQYLFNPAQSGLTDKELNFNIGFLRESASVNNGPKTMYLTGEYGLTERVGLGLNLITDKFGPLSTTKLMITYAYHLKLNSDDQKLSFGVSAGGVQQKVNEFDVVGDLSDKLIYDFNQNKMLFEADFGAAYSYDKLSLQAAVPNIVASLRNTGKNELNQSTFFASAAYKFEIDNTADITIEPKAAFRSYKGIESILDLGANATFLQKFNVFGLYHTNQNITAGLGLKFLNALQFSAAYTTQNSGLKQSFSGSNFEVGLRYFVRTAKK